MERQAHRKQSPPVQTTARQGIMATSTETMACGPRSAKPDISKFSNDNWPLWHVSEGVLYTSHLVLWSETHGHPTSLQAQACEVLFAHWMVRVLLLRVLSFSHFVKEAVSLKVRKELILSRSTG